MSAGLKLVLVHTENCSIDRIKSVVARALKNGFINITFHFYIRGKLSLTFLVQTVKGDRGEYLLRTVDCIYENK